MHIESFRMYASMAHRLGLAMGSHVLLQILAVAAVWLCAGVLAAPRPAPSEEAKETQGVPAADDPLARSKKQTYSSRAYSSSCCRVY